MLIVHVSFVVFGCASRCVVSGCVVLFVLYCDVVRCCVLSGVAVRCFV